MSFQLQRDLQQLKSENQQLRTENLRLRAESQAAKQREERYKNELEIIKKGFADRNRRDQERLDRLMLEGHTRRWNTVPVKSESDTSKQVIFPQEIMDRFIDHLYDNRKTLMTCALVCRAWVPSSRFHLFSLVNISALQYGSRPLAGLIGHLDHPLCTFTSSVRRLDIYASTDDGYPTPYNLSRGWLAPLIPHLAKLVSVKSLFGNEIAGWETIISWQAILKSASFTSQITYLHLHNPLFTSFEECMKTIQSFPSLVHLEYSIESMDQLNDCENEWTVNLPAFKGSLPTTLCTLELPYINVYPWISSTVQSAWSQLMWQWLHRSQTRLSTIKLGLRVSISSGDVTAAKLQSFSKYLQFLGPSLEMLQVGFNDAPSISLFFDNIDVTFNTGLRVLELGGFFKFDIETQSYDGRILSLPMLLSRIPKGALTTVKFEFDIITKSDYSEAFIDTTWIAIDKLLSSCPALNKVAFRVGRMQAKELAVHFE